MNGVGSMDRLFTASAGTLTASSLRTLRQERGWGVRALAEKSSVPAGYIPELENGKKANPGLE